MCAFTFNAGGKPVEMCFSFTGGMVILVGECSYKDLNQLGCFSWCLSEWQFNTLDRYIAEALPHQRHVDSYPLYLVCFYSLGEES